MDFSTEWWLLAIGFLRSVIPVSFWYFSLLGSFFLLAYAILRRDIVFIVGQSTGSVIYVRNLYLIQRERMRLQRAG